MLLKLIFYSTFMVYCSHRFTQLHLTANKQDDDYALTISSFTTDCYTLLLNTSH